MALKYQKLINYSLACCFCIVTSSCNTAYTTRKNESSLTIIAQPEAKQSDDQPVINSATNTDQVKKHDSNESPSTMTSTSTDTDTNQFNRLMKNKHTIQKNLRNDGIHDQNNPATRLLQSPYEAFSILPKAKSGNGVDWVMALETGKIKPRNDLYNPETEAFVMDLNIVREVKGSMPDVVFPHKQHTELLDCTSCHPGIFIPQKGANHMSMAKNLLGEMCGVCHGKVAFPLSRCTACHSKQKPQKEIKKTGWKWP